VVKKIERFIKFRILKEYMIRRVVINDPKLFFKEITNNESLREFCNKNKVVYSTAKQWARGENFIPENIFKLLLKHSNRKKYWLSKSVYKEGNWGPKRGAEINNKKSAKELKSRMEKARSAIKSKPKEVKFKITKGTCEFFGALMGDGCITKHKLKGKKHYKYIIIFSGHKYLEKKYHEDYLRSLIKNEFNLNSSIALGKKQKVRTLKIFNRSLLEELVRYDFPLGKKGQKLEIPKKLSKLSWKYKKFIIRGLFDTDGSIYARKDENYMHPHISITSISKKLIRQLYYILRERNYPAWITKSNNSKSAESLVIKGNKNTIKWMEDIGSSNSKHLFKYKHWLKNKELPARLLKW
tara:strand:+ start:1319 stop:2377 length:1059 start_codon:yes stop_codon:yes gene_type:complete